jgi:hypothetical protein
MYQNKHRNNMEAITQHVATGASRGTGATRCEEQTASLT